MQLVPVYRLVGELGVTVADVLEICRERGFAERVTDRLTPAQATEVRHRFAKPSVVLWTAVFVISLMPAFALAPLLKWIVMWWGWNTVAGLPAAFCLAVGVSVLVWLAATEILLRLWRGRIVRSSCFGELPSNPVGIGGLSFAIIGVGVFLWFLFGRLFATFDFQDEGASAEWMYWFLGLVSWATVFATAGQVWCNTLAVRGVMGVVPKRQEGHAPWHATAQEWDEQNIDLAIAVMGDSEAKGQMAEHLRKMRRQMTEEVAEIEREYPPGSKEAHELIDEVRALYMRKLRPGG